MEEKAFAFIQKHSLLLAGNTVVVAFSGGADSMALLHFLWKNQEKLNIKVVAAHLNHGLRGSESDGEEQFVRRVCDGFSVPLFIGKANMLDRDSPKGMGTEEFARKLRYDFLEEVAKENNAKIATAHTLSDNSETVLFNMIRGSGPRGARGIAPKREIIIRPLLSVSRAEIEAYCEENKLQYVTDSSNLELVYTRNRMRLRVLPLLEEIHMGAENSIGAFAEDMLEIDGYLHSLASKLLAKAKTENGYKIAEFINEPTPVVKYAFSLLGGSSITRNNLILMQKVLQGEITATMLPDDRKFIQNEGVLQIVPAQNQKEKPSAEVLFAEGLFTFFKPFEFSVEVLDFEEEIDYYSNTAKNGLTFLADYDKINSNAVFRTRKARDFFVFSQRKVSKTIKKWMNEEKIPIDLRDVWPVLALEEEILWAYGIGFTQSVEIDSTTVKIVRIEAQLIN